MHDEGNNEDEKKNLHVSTHHVDKNDKSLALTLKDQCSHYYIAVAEVLTGMKQSEKIEMLDTTANFG
jgi:hypothetical protein